MNEPSSPSPGEITELLARWETTDRETLDQLIPLVLGDLRRLARHHLASEPPHGTLQPTALVSELYLRLTGVKIDGFENRRSFFRFASRLLRQILIDRARFKKAAKRSGEHGGVELHEGLSSLGDVDADAVLAVHEALGRLEQSVPRRARIVELRFFLGLSNPEVAKAMDISLATVEREWSAARTWLARELGN